MNEQPEALRLADAISERHEPDFQDAAAELRRLHDLLGKANALARIRYERNQYLLEALVQICVQCRSNEWGPDTPRKEILRWFHDHASAAIARAEKETK